ncbi:MAG: RluA family pseudouridine synthase [Clostridiaceae bacterium]|nr:RluA family pseudouridine synthase [Clostridiaceae bacterium]
MIDPDTKESPSSGGPDSPKGPLSFAIDDIAAGESLIRAILNQYPQIRSSVIYKALRRKDIRLNGRRLHADCSVAAGDQVMVYLPVKTGGTISAGHSAAETPDRRVQPARSQPSYRIVYQDSQILVVCKDPGISVEPGQDPADREPTLIDRLHSDLGNPAIQLCHRLDRQTGGLMLAAVYPAAGQAIRQLMQEKMIVKRYRCLVRGVPDTGQPVRCQDGTMMQELTAWLEKDAGHSDVYIHDDKEPGDLPIITRYRVIHVFPGTGPDQEAVSELEVELVTGRTHQIRAHLAHLGHPILGDGKYGRNSYNRFFRGTGGPLRRQQLWAVSLSFAADCPAPLTSFSGRVFRIEPHYDWNAGE